MPWTPEVVEQEALTAKVVRDLTHGGPLAAAALERVRAEAGRCVPVVGGDGAPPGSPDSGTRKPGSDARLIELLGELFGSRTPYLVLVLDDLAKPGDQDWCSGQGAVRKVLDRPDSIVLEDQVLHGFEVTPDGLRGLPSFLRGSASGHPGVAILTTSPRHAPPPGTCWPLAVVPEIVAGMIGLCLSAYDQEGWLLWLPSATDERPIHELDLGGG